MPFLAEVTINKNNVDRFNEAAGINPRMPTAGRRA